ncbi:MAG: DUF4430 domain-containing protein [Oscillospiraceae bacterium]|nr:DUF4430 domain-containing protein [Oscillospiraceae bacterium]
MKKRILSLLLILCLVLTLCACSNTKAPDLWENALYTEDTELGQGAKTVTVQVQAEDKTVNFTIHTDSATLGEALLEHGLVEGDMGEFGLYIKKVNGILADYDVDQSYWGFYSGGEYMMSGVDTTEISGGESYELIRTR